MDIVDKIEPFGSIEIMTTGSEKAPNIKSGVLLPKYEWFVEDFVKYKDKVEVPKSKTA